MASQAEESMGTLTHGATVNLYGSGFNMATRLLFNVLVARLVGQSGVGIYFIALSVANLSSVLAIGGLDTTLVRYLARQRSSGDWGSFRGTLRFILRTAIGLSLVATTVMVVGAPWIATRLLHNAEITTPLRIVGFWVPLFVAETLMLSATQSFQIMKYRVYIESILDPSLRFVLVIILYLVGGGLNAILWAYVFSVLVCAILASLALRRCIPVKLEDYPALVNSRQLLGFSYPLFSYNVLLAIMLYVDSLLVAHFRNSADVGMYSVCIRLVATTCFITPVLGQIFGPICSEMHHRQEIGQLAASTKVVTLLATQMFLPLLVVFFSVPELILGVFGPGFRAAAWCLRVLIIGQSANYLTGPTGLVLNMGGWTRLQLTNTATVACLQILLDVLLIPSRGILGAAIANCVALVTLNSLQLYQLNQRLRFHPFSAALGKPLVAAVAAVGATLLLRNQIVFGGPWDVVLKGFVAVSTYSVALAFLGLDPHSRSALLHVRSVIWPGYRQESLSILTGR
jgi:O-antigen/teichoic acid export membrane protein